MNLTFHFGLLVPLLSLVSLSVTSQFYFPSYPFINPCNLCCGGLIFIILIIILFYLLLKDESSFFSTQICPYCGEKIPEDAVWCKYCKRDLSKRGLDRSNQPHHGAPGRSRVHPPVEKKKELCPDCNFELRFIEEYERWYCDRCRKYQKLEGTDDDSTVNGQT